MTGLLLSQDTAAFVTGVAAAVCLTAGPSFRSRRAILVAQLAAGACFAAHYACLGVAVAAAVNVLGLVQTGAALLAARSASMNWLGYALIGLMGFVGIWLWQGPISLLSVAAMTLIAVARMQSDVLHLRLLLLAGGGFWLIHDLLAGAWIALAADIGAVLMGAAALCSILFRITIELRPRPPVLPAM